MQRAGYWLREISTLKICLRRLQIHCNLYDGKGFVLCDARSTIRIAVKSPSRINTTELGLDPNIFNNPARFIATLQQGVSGKVLRRALDQFDEQSLFERAMSTDTSGLKEYCSDTSLDCQSSEILLDTIRVLDRICQVWESDELAKQWLHSSLPVLGGAKPIDLFDTYEGRRWVKNLVEKIEVGEFS